ncbi:MAG: hypothetical protein KC736_00030 [Candidatus Moranbacteria bacterium]|nr:hypothetical protein [Candidatus Moranbacteria bacterium]
MNDFHVRSFCWEYGVVVISLVFFFVFSVQELFAQDVNQEEGQKFLLDVRVLPPVVSVIGDDGGIVYIVHQGGRFSVDVLVSSKGDMSEKSVVTISFWDSQMVSSGVFLCYHLWSLFWHKKFLSSFWWLICD